MFDEMEEIRLMLITAMRSVEDTQLLLGSIKFQQARKFYKNVKSEYEDGTANAAKLYDELHVFYKRSTGSSKAEPNLPDKLMGINEDGLDGTNDQPDSRATGTDDTDSIDPDVIE